MKDLRDRFSRAVNMVGLGVGLGGVCEVVHSMFFVHVVPPEMFCNPTGIPRT